MTTGRGEFFDGDRCELTERCDWTLVNGDWCCSRCRRADDVDFARKEAGELISGVVEQG